MDRKLLALAIFLACAGCETEVVRHVNLTPGLGDEITSGDEKKVTRESILVDKVKKDPKDAQAWFELGEYYENGMQLAEAASAYEQGNALMEPGRYTGGEYLLARVYLRVQDWKRSIEHLDNIFKLEPKDPKSACLNSHFREAHYLRGAIYFLSKDYRLAKREFARFLEIGGDESRVEEWLDEIQLHGE